MALTNTQWREKFGVDPDRDADLFYDDIVAEFDGRKDDINYVPIYARAKMRDIYGTAVSYNMKDVKPMTKEEIHEAISNSRPKNNQAKAANTNTDQQAAQKKSINIEDYFARLSEKDTLLLGIKLYNKIVTDPKLSAIKDIANQAIICKGDSNKIAEIFSNITKDEFKKMISLTIDSINADPEFADVSAAINNLLTTMEKNHITIDAAIDMIEAQVVSRLHPEDDTPESTAVAAVVPESIIPEEVLDPNGQVISSIVADDKQEDIAQQPEEETKKVLTFSPDDYVVNNKSFWEVYPKLEAFNKALSKEGFFSIYANREGGLLTMTLVDMKTNVAERTLIVDPGIVYGDTVRVLTNTNKDKDLRKELYIPVSSSLFKKLVHGEQITKEERQEQMKTLPRAISDFRNQYSFLDRVDMSELYNVKITFKQWFNLVINISNVLINPDVPICRFKLHKYENPNKFMLYVDDEDIKNPLNSAIMNEDSHKNANVKAVAIDYDPAMYKDAEDPTGEVVNNTYVIGNIEK